MKKKLLKRLLGIFSIFGISFLTWVAILLNPSFVYAHQTTVGKVIIHHNQALPDGLDERLEEGFALVEKSALYDPSYNIHLCMNDGHIYAKLVSWYKGPGIAYTLLDNVALNTDISVRGNYAEWQWEINNGVSRRWKLNELIAHEFTHAYQYNYAVKMALQQPFWKVEGYAEYIARQDRGKLTDNIDKYLKAKQEETGNWDWITFEDGTGVSYLYLKSWLLVQYLMEEEGLSFEQLLADEREMETVEIAMQKWEETADK